MLSLRQLDDAGATAVALFAETEQSIINDMARRIARLGGVTEATNWQALRLELSGSAQDDIIRELSRALNKAEPEIIAMFDEAATRATESDNEIFRASGKSPIPLADNAWLRQIVRAGLIKTLDEFRNLTRTTAGAANQQFIHTLDLAYQQIISGAYSYQQAIKNGISVPTDSGITAITYPTRHVDYLDAAVRRAALTGVNQTAAEVQLANMAQMDADLVETTAHMGARPSHAEWQGRVFSRSGSSREYPQFEEATGYGTGPGLCGWNCRHSFFPYFEGTERANTGNQLRAMNDKQVTYNDKPMSLYDASQEQRRIERQIRHWKREEGALAAAGQDNTAARGKVREWQKRQRDFIKQTGLRRDYFRERAGVQHLQ